MPIKVNVWCDITGDKLDYDTRNFATLSWFDDEEGEVLKFVRRDKVVDGLYKWRDKIDNVKYMPGFTLGTLIDSFKLLEDGADVLYPDLPEYEYVPVDSGDNCCGDCDCDTPETNVIQFPAGDE